MRALKATPTFKTSARVKQFLVFFESLRAHIDTNQALS